MQKTEKANGYVSINIHNGMATIEFFHPQSNSLPSAILKELAHAIHGVSADDDVKVILLKSAGDKSFCAGASFDELLAIENEEQGIRFFAGFAQVINAIRKCPKFVVGRIHGKCVGGGVGLAAACDYAIACNAAEVKLSELAVGIGPYVVGPAIERKIGLSAYSALAIDTTMWRNADWAKRKGLYAELYDTIEEMDEAISRLTLSLVKNSPEAMAKLKEVLWHGTSNWDVLLQERAAISGKLIMGEFARNFIIKFKEGVKAKAQ